MNNTSSGANETIIFDLFPSTAGIIGYSLVYGILGSIALVGNIMVLMVVYMNDSMRTTINILFVNLSTSDILYALLGLPGYMSTDICNQRWLLGRAMAVICHGISMLSTAVSALTLIAIAFERYFAIVYPLKNRVRDKKKAIFWKLFIIWTFSIALATPFAIKTTTRTVPLHVRENGQIKPRNITFLSLEMDVDKWQVYYMIVFVSMHVLPLVSLGILYSGIAWSLWKPDERLTEAEPAGDTANRAMTGMSERNRRKTTLMVIVVFIVFFICFFPFHLYYIINDLFNDFKKRGSLEATFLKIMLSLNAAMNPIIYNLLSESFRAKFRAILSCGQREKLERSGSSMTRVHAVSV